jgi:uncharacterized protein (UPF0332 family)
MSFRRAYKLPDNEEIGSLLERAERRLDAAQYLFNQGFFADAVSRAYYSMYFAAKALLLTKDISVKTHKGLVSKFGLEFVDEGVVETYYGRALRTAEELREEADYSISREISREEAKSLIEEAEKFLERIKRAMREMSVMK